MLSEYSWDNIAQVNQLEQVNSVNQLNKVETAVRIFYPATGQTSIQTLSRQVKLSVSHSMLPKAMQSCLVVSVKFQDQECINFEWNRSTNDLMKYHQRKEDSVRNLFYKTVVDKNVVKTLDNYMQKSSFLRSCTSYRSVDTSREL